MKKDGYKLTRAWFDFAFENKNAKATHTALFLWCVEVNNKCGWKDEFGLPAAHSMEVLSIANKETYYNALNDLQTFGFIKIVQQSKNQYMSCIISICYDFGNPKNLSALSLAIVQQDGQQPDGTINGTVPIDKHINLKPKTIKDQPETISFKKMTEVDFADSIKPHLQQFGKELCTDFYNYWSEKSESGKMKFQLQKTWEVKKRLLKWQSNNFGNKTNPILSERPSLLKTNLVT